MESISEIQVAIGEWLAMGYTDEQIVNELVLTSTCETEEEAQGVLKSVYNRWQDTKSALDLQSVDILQWHIYMRKKLLQKALETHTLPSIKIALSILDSLAAVEGISTVEPPTVPIHITLTERESIDEPKTG